MIAFTCLTSLWAQALYIIVLSAAVLLYWRGRYEGQATGRLFRAHSVISVLSGVAMIATLVMMSWVSASSAPPETLWVVFALSAWIALVPLAVGGAAVGLWAASELPIGAAIDGDLLLAGLGVLLVVGSAVGVQIVVSLLC